MNLARRTAYVHYVEPNGAMIHIWLKHSLYKLNNKFYMGAFQSSCCPPMCIVYVRGVAVCVRQIFFAFSHSANDFLHLCFCLLIKVRIAGAYSRPTHCILIHTTVLIWPCAYTVAFHWTQPHIERKNNATIKNNKNGRNKHSIAKKRSNNDLRSSMEGWIAFSTCLQLAG